MVPPANNHHQDVDARNTQFLSFMRIAAIALILFASVLHFPGFIAQLPPLDESLYLHNGEMLIDQGKVHIFSWNPLPTLINGVLYIPFAHNPIKLETVSTVRQYLTYLGFLVAAGWAGWLWCGSIGGWTTALIVAWSRATHIVQGNSSDALYAVSILLVVAASLRIVKSNGEMSSSIGSYLLLGLMLGITAMARNDGLVVSVMVVAAISTLLIRSNLATAKKFFAAVGLASTAVAPIVVWVTISAIQSGTWTLGTGSRTYFAFRQGYYILNDGVFDPSPGMTRVESEFGTEQDNHGSVIAAIAYHRSAFGRRLAKVPSCLIRGCRDAYGTAVVPALVVALIVGIFGLITSGQAARVSVMFAIAAPVGAYFITFFRIGYLAMNFPFFVIVAVCGCIEILQRSQMFRVRQSLTMGILVLLALANAFHFVRTIQKPETTQVDPKNDKKWISSLAATVPIGQPVLAVDPSQLFYSGIKVASEYRKIFNLDELNQTATPVEMFISGKFKWVIVDSNLKKTCPELYTQIIFGHDYHEAIRDDPGLRSLYRMNTP